jgi:undecaprenyl phosphate N,N'-diacetylbacillosamine 1-phosphate transferase
MYIKYFKRLSDFFISLSLLILLSPVLIITILILIANNSGKVFFIQARPGQNDEIFKLIKFRTMTDERDNEGKLLPDEKRLTKTGKMIRQLSLDELPQLLNVIKGDMSLIGPRPWLVEYLPLYNDFQRRRHEVKPGITGWAQVNGRNAVSWEKRFEYDVYYVDHVTFVLDAKIFFLTIWKILKGEGISGRDSVTMKKFG